MNSLKKLFKKVFLIPVSVALVLLPISISFLIYSLADENANDVIKILSYLLSAYTLTVWCIKIPKLIFAIKEKAKSNKYITVWTSDLNLRTKASLYGSLFGNVLYAIFQLVFGILNSSFWFCSLAVYYFCLAIMRFFLAKSLTVKATEQKEIKIYRLCGRVLLALNIVLALMVFFMVYWNRGFQHGEIITIAIAAYTFVIFVIAVINFIKYRKNKNLIISASKIVNLVVACVSMLTLTSTMLNTFGNGTENIEFRHNMLVILGTVISAFTISLAIYMLTKAKKLLIKL